MTSQPQPVTEWTVLLDRETFDTAYKTDPLPESEDGPAVPSRKYWIEFQEEGGNTTSSRVRRSSYVDGIWQEPEIFWTGTFILMMLNVKMNQSRLQFFSLDGNSKPEHFEMIRPLLPVLSWRLRSLFSSAESTSRFHKPQEWEDFDRLKESAIEAYLEDEAARRLQSEPSIVHEPKEVDWL